MNLQTKKNMVLLVTLVFLILAASLPAFAADSAKFITTTGEGVIKAKPDVASICMSVVGQGKTAQEARNKNAATMNNVLKELKKLGVSADQIQKVSFNVFPLQQSTEGKDENKITGYQGNSQIIIKTSNLDGIGTIIDTAIEAGVNNVQNITYGVKDEEAWSLKALEKAVSSAQKKGKVIAQTLGLTIKGVSGVNEQFSYVNTYSMDSNMVRAAVKSVENTIPLQAPQYIEVKSNVTINFSI